MLPMRAQRERLFRCAFVIFTNFLPNINTFLEYNQQLFFLFLVFLYLFLIIIYFKLLLSYLFCTIYCTSTRQSILITFHKKQIKKSAENNASFDAYLLPFSFLNGIVCFYTKQTQPQLVDMNYTVKFTINQYQIRIFYANLINTIFTSKLFHYTEIVFISQLLWNNYTFFFLYQDIKYKTIPKIIKNGATATKTVVKSITINTATAITIAFPYHVLRSSLKLLAFPALLSVPLSA